MKKRVDRHDVIREIVRTERVKTQRSLVEHLKKRGFDVTQATISRDITEMGLRKLPEGIYALAEDLYLQRMVSDLVTDVRRTGNLVLIKASPGTGPGVAAALDAADLPGVLGSIAGDDTILVIGNDEKEAEDFEAAIGKLRP